MPDENSQCIKVFISYKKDGAAPDVPQKIYDRLHELGFDVFMDKAKLKAGEAWAAQIRDNVRASDVVLLLLEPAAIESEWVQREVDMAVGACVTVIPLTVTVSQGTTDEKSQAIKDLMKRVQEKLAIYEKQYTYYETFLKEAPIEALWRAAEQTRMAQRDAAAKLSDQRYPKPPKFYQRYRTFELPYNQSGCKVHITFGDMLRVKDVDVIVNSENTYMQMARHFESNTLSSQLRYAGALKDDADQIIEDTVQDDLNRWIEWNWKKNKSRRPYHLARTIIPTRAGHPKSFLRTNTGARYIFHAAAIEVIGNREPGTPPIAPIRAPDNLKELVRRCLNQLVTINQTQGQISGPANPEVHSKAAESFTPLTSIIFPLFGAGQGGQAVHKVIGPMAEAFCEYLSDHTKEQLAGLTDIYISVYLSGDRQWVESALKAAGFESPQ